MNALLNVFLCSILHDFFALHSQDGNSSPAPLQHNCHRTSKTDVTQSPTHYCWKLKELYEASRGGGEFVNLQCSTLIID